MKPLTLIPLAAMKPLTLIPAARFLLSPNPSQNPTFLRLFHASNRLAKKPKEKWASMYKPVGASHLALEFMDAHYPRLYGPQKWTMMRIAMLSRRKYAMLFNSYFPEQVERERERFR